MRIRMNALKGNQKQMKYIIMSQNWEKDSKGLKESSQVFGTIGLQLTFMVLIIGFMLGGGLRLYLILGNLSEEDL